MYEARYFITFSGILFLRARYFMYSLLVAMKTHEWDGIVSRFSSTFAPDFRCFSWSQLYW